MTNRYNKAQVREMSSVPAAALFALLLASCGAFGVALKQHNGTAGPTSKPGLEVKHHHVNRNHTKEHVLHPKNATATGTAISKTTSKHLNGSMSMHAKHDHTPSVASGVPVTALSGSGRRMLTAIQQVVGRMLLQNAAAVPGAFEIKSQSRIPGQQNFLVRFSQTCKILRRSRCVWPLQMI